MTINLTLIGQMITFALLVWFTMRFIWPPLMKAMHERQKKIADGLAAAERSNRELELAKHQATKVLREAKLEASHIIEQANKRALQIQEEAREQARSDSHRILQNAEQEIQQLLNNAKHDLQKQIATVAMAGAEKILRKEITPDFHQVLLEQLAGEI